jgi:hypothetical protein
VDEVISEIDARSRNLMRHRTRWAERDARHLYLIMLGNKSDQRPLTREHEKKKTIPVSGAFTEKQTGPEARESLPPFLVPGTLDTQRVRGLAAVEHFFIGTSLVV